MTTSDRSTQLAERAALFARLGGHETFELLARRFYEGVATDEVLAPMYEGDVEGGERRLRMFLEQYWGGPTTYSEERGHPRLRMRHAPFRVTPDARDRWLTHMRAALDDAGLDPESEQAMWDYFVRAADAMINTLEPRP
ncbi:globin [Georgenia sp. Z1344]|uniref:globin n=1 Tax=Georgenia sp. Z1344 TaxID=3416706 RepID=UPI003CEB917A